MKKSGVFIILLLFLLASCSKNKPSVVINRALIDDALAYGEKNASLSFYEFVKPWTIDLGYQVGKGYTTLLTPFLRVAILGKNTYEQKGTVDINTANRVYGQEKNTLHFLLILYGDDPTFSERIKVFLVYNKKNIAPTFVSFPNYTRFSRDYTQIAKGEVKFSKEGIPDNAVITLVTEITPRETSGKIQQIEFTFNLSNYR